MNRTDFLLQLAAVALGTLVALAIWSVVAGLLVKNQVDAQLQAARSNPLLRILAP